MRGETCVGPSCNVEHFCATRLVWDEPVSGNVCSNRHDNCWGRVLKIQKKAEKSKNERWPTKKERKKNSSPPRPKRKTTGKKKKRGDTKEGKKENKKGREKKMTSTTTTTTDTKTDLRNATIDKQELSFLCNYRISMADLATAFRPADSELRKCFQFVHSPTEVPLHLVNFLTGSKSKPSVIWTLQFEQMEFVNLSTYHA